MVNKTSHRGVHSGNTLRAFNSRYSRRYHGQACIVPRVGLQLLKNLAGQQSDDKLGAEPRNVAVDVALSLNKQSRWLLPSSLIRQIRDSDSDSDDIGTRGQSGGLTVSLLVRHKLKRPASCVSFHSNRGEVKRIEPRHGRYFSFNFPAADGKSRRALRRQQRQELQEELRKYQPDSEIVGRKVELFTEQGRAKTNLGIGESEVGRRVCLLDILV